MAKTTRQRKIQVAAVLLSFCALGGTAILKPQAIFKDGTAITAYAYDFKLNGCEFTVNGSRCILTNYSGTASSLTLPTNSSFPTSSYTYEVGDQVFLQNSTLTSITIPAGYKSVGEKSFYGCKKLTTLNLRNATSLTTIGDEAFAYCTALKTIDMTNATKLSGSGYRAFHNCQALTSVTLPKSGMTSISYASFYNCSSLPKIELPDSITTINSSAFYMCSALKTVKGVDDGSQKNLIHTKIQTVGSQAFSKSGVRDLTFPATVTSIGAGAFADCTTLVSCDLDSTKITTVSNGLFENCTNLGPVWIPGTVNTIEQAAFKNCTSSDFRLIDCTYTMGVDLSTGALKKIAPSTGNWYDVFEGMETLMLKYYVNNRLAVTAGDINKDIWLDRPSDSDISVKVQTNFSDSTIGVFDDMTKRKNNDNYTTFSKLVTNLPIPLPGKVFSAANCKLSDTVINNHKACDLFTLNWVKCYDAKTNKELAEGQRFQPGTNYYYKFSVTTKSGVALNLAEYLNGNISSAHADAESAPKTKVSTYNGHTASEKRSVSTSLSVASGGCTSQTLVFNTFVRLNSYAVYTTEDGYTYPYSNCVNGTVAARIGGKLNNVSNTTTSVLYEFKKPDPVITLNKFGFDPNDSSNPNKGYLYDQSLYTELGAPDVMYGYRKAGSTGSITWLYSYDLTNLEPDTTYDVFFSDYDASNYQNATFFSTQFTTNGALILKSAQLSLEGEIGLQFATELTHSMRGSGAYANFKYPVEDLTSSNYRAQRADWQDNDVFTCWLAAKQVYDPITLYYYHKPANQLGDWSLCGGRISNVLTPREFTYSVAKYVDAVSASSSNAKMVNLSQAIKNYGIFAQRYFNYHTSLIPAADFDAAIDSISNVTAADLAPYAAKVSGTKPDGLASGNATFVCESSSELRLNLTFSGVSAESFDYTIDGQTAYIQTEGTTKYLAVSDIMAKDLDKFHTFTISRGGKTLTLKACGLTYAQGALSKTDVPLKNLSKALYTYNQAAKAYFAS